MLRLPVFASVRKSSGLVITGGTITESGGYRYHTFDSTSSLVIEGKGTKEIEYCIAAGGGGSLNSPVIYASSGWAIGTGGGGGGRVEVGSKVLSSGTYAVTVGGGGARRDYIYHIVTHGNSGSTSSIASVATADAGQGARWDFSGGSSRYSGGKEIKQVVEEKVFSGGGGGGGDQSAGAAATSLSGTAAGGNGRSVWGTTYGQGGIGRGGGNPATGSNGTANRGMGGGGAKSNSLAGSGGSGRVVIRYPI